MPASHPTSWDVYDPDCPSRTVLDLIARRWTVLIVGALAGGPQRFGQLRRRVGGISAKVLTQVLRELARNGLVTRTLYPEIPPRTEYELTELGEALIGPIGALVDWAEDNIETIIAIRIAADDPHGEETSGTPAGVG